MLKIHWSSLVVLVICVIGVLFLLYQSMVSGKSIPEGGIAFFASIASWIIGYSAGSSGETKNEATK